MLTSEIRAILGNDVGQLRHSLSRTYNGAEYFYLKNAQGDVTGLVNSSGTQVVAYTYDAWGNPLTTAGTMADTLGKLNPFRYKY